MPLLSLIVSLIVIGLLLYLINTLIPMDPKIKQILNVVGGYCRGAVGLGDLLPVRTCLRLL